METAIAIDELQERMTALRGRMIEAEYEPLFAQSP